MVDPIEIEAELAAEWYEGTGSRRFVARKRSLMSPSWSAFCDTYMPGSPYMLQGRLSWWEPSTHTTWIDRSVAPFELSDVVRRWMRRRIGNRAAAGFSGLVDLLTIPAPLYFVGGKLVCSDMAYVDLRRAYYSIYTGRSYDMALAVTPTRVVVVDGRLSLDADVTEWYAHDAESRNSIVGMARSAELRIARYGKLARVRATGNRTTNGGLWGYVALVLNAIATEVVEWYRGVYVGTDGYIVPGDRAEPLRTMLAERWNFDSSTKGRGQTTVTGMGRYSVGGYKTRTGTGAGDPHDNLVRLERDQRDSLARTMFRA